MKDAITEHMKYQTMIHDLNRMSKQEINQELVTMGCKMSYDEIKESLAHTYNELAISDQIFKQDSIKEGRYPVSFIDEAVLEIAIRENFGFLHYGILSNQIRDIMEPSISNSEKIKLGVSCFKKLCQTAEKFDISALETIDYQVHDDLDLYASLMTFLDLMMQEAEKDKQLYRTIVDLCERLLKTFSKSYPLLRISIQYEQATAYVRMKSKKGEQLFLHLLKVHSDPCDVVLHYALAYLDQDEKRAIRILHKYQNLWNKESEAYEVIMQILKDCEH